MRIANLKVKMKNETLVDEQEFVRRPQTRN
jgi:hypothetical protein